MLVQRAPARLTWTQVATFTGRKAKGGSFGAAVRELRGGGLVENGGGLVWASDKALKASGGIPRRRQSPAEVLAMWCEKLPPPAPAILRELDARGPRRREELAEALGRQSRGGSWNGGIRVLRNNWLIEIHGGVIELAAELRPRR